MHWSKRPVEKLDDKNGTAFLSVVFTWHLEQAYQRAVWLREQGYKVLAGGPAVKLMPDYLSSVADCNSIEIDDAVSWHNPQATFTSRGCVRKCPFCAVPKTEGHLIELSDWPVRPIICDNNLLACSKKHFDDVIDKVKMLKGVDFNQGLDSRLLTKYHADRLAEVKSGIIRLAFDSVDYENAFLSSFDILVKAGINPDNIRVYVLIGFDDTPDDAMYRLRWIRALGAWPNPMRYQPLNCMKFNSYVGKNWTNKQLADFMRYWSRSMFFERIGVSFYDYERK